MSFTADQVEAEVRSLEKFAREGWSYATADGSLNPRGMQIQEMLQEFSQMLRSAQDEVRE